jgi:Mrp family chromosome partitioning ATPase
VVLVDANFRHPRLGKRLGLVPPCGWEDVLRGRLPLEEVLIESTRNPLTVLPLLESVAESGPLDDRAQRAVTESLATLSRHFGLVLVDLGPLEPPGRRGESSRGPLPVSDSTPIARALADGLDAVVLVYGLRDADQDRLAEAQRGLAAAEVAAAGLIQNFVRP